MSDMHGKHILSESGTDLKSILDRQFAFGGCLGGNLDLSLSLSLTDGGVDLNVISSVRHPRIEHLSVYCAHSSANTAVLFRDLSFKNMSLLPLSLMQGKGRARRLKFLLIPRVVCAQVM